MSVPASAEPTDLASVRIQFEDDCLTITVRDTSPVVEAGVPGVGMSSMVTLGVNAGTERPLPRAARLDS